MVNGEPYPLDMRGELDDTAAFKNFKKCASDFPRTLILLVACRFWIYSYLSIVQVGSYWISSTIWKSTQRFRKFHPWTRWEGTDSELFLSLFCFSICLPIKIAVFWFSWEMLDLQYNCCLMPKFDMPPLLFQTSASLKFTVLNPKGRIWTMVAGGGASVIYADTVRWTPILILIWSQVVFNASAYCTPSP